MENVIIIGETPKLWMAGEAVELVACSDSFMVNKNLSSLQGPWKWKTLWQLAVTITNMNTCTSIKWLSHYFTKSLKCIRQLILSTGNQERSIAVMQIVNGRLSGLVNRIFWLTHGEQEPFFFAKPAEMKNGGGYCYMYLTSIWLARKID